MAVADLGKGPGGARSPLIFIPIWGAKGRKKFFWRPPRLLYQSLDDRAPLPPPPLFEGLDQPLNRGIAV